MKRRQFLWSAASLAGGLLPPISWGQTRPCPPPALSAGNGTPTNTSCNASDADADWLYRSTYPGVVWAHDFRSLDEVSRFRMSPNDGLANQREHNDLDVKWLPSSGIGSSGAIASRVRATTLSAPIGKADTVIPLVDVSEFPDPAIHGEYQCLLGWQREFTSVSPTNGAEEVTVKSVSYTNNTITVVRTKSETFLRSHVAGEGFSFADRSRWNRLMGCLSRAENGRDVDDPGLTPSGSFPAMKNRDDDWVKSSRSNYRFRGAYWGHPSYEALYDARWPINGYDTYTTNAGRSYTDTFDGNEFWIQFRMRVSASRTDNPQGKLFYLQNMTRSTRQQLYFAIARTQSETWGSLLFKHDGQSTVTDIPLTNGGNGLYSLPLDTWTTYMLHIKPGRYQVPEGTLEVFAAAPGEGWVQLCSVNNFPWWYTLPAASVENPPAYNSFSPVNYQNHYEGSSSAGAAYSTHTAEYTQIILSRSEIPCPQD